KQTRVHAVSPRRAKHRARGIRYGGGSKRAARDHQRVPFLWRKSQPQECQWKERERLCSERLDSRTAAVIAAENRPNSTMAHLCQRSYLPPTAMRFFAPLYNVFRRTSYKH